MQAPDFQVQNDRALFRKAGLAAPELAVERNGGIARRGAERSKNFKSRPVVKWGCFATCSIAAGRNAGSDLPGQNAGGTATGTTISGREYRLLYSSFRYSPYHPPLPRTALEYAQDERCRLQNCQLSMKSKQR
jgi:hypothetical protein